MYSPETPPLWSAGVRSNTLSWIADFLSGRSHEVVLEGKHSAQCKVTLGVHQGTVIDSLLFLVYINDMPPCVTSRARLFAKLKLMPPSSRRTLMPCKTGKIPGRCHLILTSVRYYPSPTSVIRSWQIIISTANNFKSSTTPNTSALPSPKISCGTIT